MGDIFHRAKTVRRRTLQTPNTAAFEHRLLGFHLAGRNQRDLPQRSRKGTFPRTA